MRKIQFFVGMALVAFLAVAVVSCTSTRSKLEVSEIEDMYSNSIVLVQNQYYYTAKIDDMVFYFTGIDSDGDMENMTLDEDEAAYVTAYGTGFIVSEDGKIATNSHVVTPPIDESAVKANIRDLRNTIARTFADEVNAMGDTLSLLNSYYMQVPSGSYEEEQIIAYIEDLKERRDHMQSIVEAMHGMDLSNMEVECHRSIGVAYNNTYITKTTDFDECVLKADDPAHDVAVVQLKSKRTPADCKVVDVNKYDETHELAPYDENGDYLDVDDVKLGSRLTIIGFNLGPHLALTEDGIKAQTTSGNLSQNTDDTRMMYTIPTLHGSSGSPVFNEYGDFVGVNYAGLDITQNFNYGIKGKHLRQILH